MSTALKLMMFALFDHKGAAFGTPMVSRTEEEIKREILAHMRQGNSMLSQYPEDFTLFHIGEYSASTGEIKPCVPRSVTNLVHLVTPSPLQDQKPAELETSTQ